MTDQLPDHWEQFIRDMVQSGRYASDADVLDKALQLLEENDEQATLAELRQAIAIGMEQADRGELASFNPPATLQHIRSRQATGTGQS